MLRGRLGSAVPVRLVRPRVGHGRALAAPGPRFWARAPPSLRSRASGIRKSAPGGGFGPSAADDANTIRRGRRPDAVMRARGEAPRRGGTAARAGAGGRGAYCARAFAAECREAARGLDSKEAGLAGRAADLAYRAARRHPFVFLPDFAEDVINGVPGADIRSKYCIASPVDFTNLMRHALKLGSRSKKRGEDNRRRNLRKPDLREAYDLISSQAGTLRAPLESLLACSVLAAAVCDAVIRARRAPLADLHGEVAASHSKVLGMVHVPRGSRGRVSSYTRPQTERLVEHLASMSYLRLSGGAVSAPAGYSRMREVVYGTLRARGAGASYQSLAASVANRLPMLRMLPSTELFDSCIDELVGSGRVVRANTGSRNPGYSSRLFTKKNFETGARRARADALRAGRTKFFGRRAEPDAFVSELEASPPGALGAGGQVSQLAGLFLASSASLRGPRGGFDFAADVSECRFGPEQSALMRDLGLVSVSLFCKASVNRAVSAGLVRRLAGALPPGGQGVVFTCRPVSRAALDAAESEPAVRVLGRGDLLRWCAAAPTHPCRPGSVVRAMYGEGAGSVAEVRSIDYESGTASVRLVPEGEAEFPAGCLKELLESPDFEAASAEYFGMLCSLARAAPESFRDGMGMRALKVHASERAMLKSTQPHLFEAGARGGGIGSGRRTYVEFEHSVCVKLGSPSPSPDELECTCGHRLDQEHYFTLCRHIVAAVNHLARLSARMPDRARRIGQLGAAVEGFRERSVGNAVSAMCDVLDGESRLALKKHLLARADAL